MRVVGNAAQAEAGAETPRRRRHDVPAPEAEAAVAAEAAASARGGLRFALLGAGLFLVACALGGVALPLLGLVR